MTFRATVTVRRKPDFAEHKKTICQGCEYLLADTCRHPSRACGCPSNAVRVQPWLKLRQCPAARW